MQVDINLISQKFNKFLEKVRLFYTVKILKRKVTVLDILEFTDGHRSLGLCHSTRVACSFYNVDFDYFLDVCDKFNNEEAKEFGAIHDPIGRLYWWPSWEWNTGREQFLKYLIDYYRKQSPIYLIAK